jgi:hypothetical protein
VQHPISFSQINGHHDPQPSQPIKRSEEDDGLLLDDPSAELLPRKEIRSESVPRYVVDLLHLATLMASYHHHFGE